MLKISGQDIRELLRIYYIEKAKKKTIRYDWILDPQFGNRNFQDVLNAWASKHNYFTLFSCSELFQYRDNSILKTKHFEFGTLKLIINGVLKIDFNP